MLPSPKHRCLEILSHGPSPTYTRGICWTTHPSCCILDLSTPGLEPTTDPGIVGTARRSLMPAVPGVLTVIMALKACELETPTGWESLMPPHYLQARCLVLWHHRCSAGAAVWAVSAPIGRNEPLAGENSSSSPRYLLVLENIHCLHPQQSPLPLHVTFPLDHFEQQSRELMKWWLRPMPLVPPVCRRCSRNRGTFEMWPPVPAGDFGYKQI